ncbi:MAG TPA: DUF6029 family protein [Bacteroidales bacterium]|nr:DUF6029 family protein [Bacteroidales bacterium]
MRTFNIMAGLCILAGLSPALTQAQGFSGTPVVNGSFQMDVQAYRSDSVIGITEEDIRGEKLGMNAFARINYSLGGFSAGIRYEAFLKPLSGYEDQWEGQGIANRYVSYSKDQFDITLGHFYDQFGNGLVFRSYEEWSLGYDNAVDGVRVKFTPLPGIQVKGIYGTQRYYWTTYREEAKKRGIVRGVDAEFGLNELIPALKESRTQLILGGSAISKYEKDDPTLGPYQLPENVAAFAGRFQATRGKVNLSGEYAWKVNDPNELNNYIYRNGQAAFLTASYSRKGLGLMVSAKRIDNFYFKSRRTETANALDINFLPPITKQHGYSLPAMYPYATQPNGEMGVSGQAVFTLPKKTRLGGAYGTTISLGYGLVKGLKKSQVNDTLPLNTLGTLGYTSDFLAFGKVKYFEDLTLEISRKFSPTFKGILQYTRLDYNFDVVEEGIEDGHLFYTADILVLDLTRKLTATRSLRLELQYLSTDQDSGDWVAASLEYTMAPHWFFSVMDQYNFNNPVSDNTYHYYNFAFGYIRNTSRIALSYGRQREGILCVGGVCRNVPAASGLTLTLTSSF